MICRNLLIVNCICVNYEFKTTIKGNDVQKLRDELLFF